MSAFKSMFLVQGTLVNGSHVYHEIWAHKNEEARTLAAKWATEYGSGLGPTYKVFRYIGQS